MLSSLRSILQLFPFLPKEQKLAGSIRQITGQSPRNISLYRLAISHTSIAKEAKLGYTHSNERLEYLGDAVLGMVIAEFLFKKFPFKDEGFLTEIRSRIVNRESLNQLGKKIGLQTLLELNGTRSTKVSYKSLYGDALEALVGAVYLDHGFKICRDFIIHRLILLHFDITDLISNNKNFKSLLIEYVQRENKQIKFLIINEFGSTHFKEFTAQVLIDEEEIGTGNGYSKKKAEQAAAEMACIKLNLIPGKIK